MREHLNFFLKLLFNTIKYLSRIIDAQIPSLISESSKVREPDKFAKYKRKGDQGSSPVSVTSVYRDREYVSSNFIVICQKNFMSLVSKK